MSVQTLSFKEVLETEATAPTRVMSVSTIARGVLLLFCIRVGLRGYT